MPSKVFSLISLLNLRWYRYGYVIGLPKGLSDRFLEYSERIGVIELYRKLLTEQVGFQLKSDQFTSYKPEIEQQLGQ